MVLAHLRRIDADTNMARFYCIDLAATLFGEVTVLRRWGRIGTCGRTSLETWLSAGEAEASANRTLWQKTRRGYSLVEPPHNRGNGA
jgi:predicted DNA-binding WGR domain protein